MSPRADVDMLPAGRELDALIAEQVMGWVRSPNASQHAWGAFGADDKWRPVRNWSEPEYNVFPFQPSIDIFAAWAVVEKCLATCPEHERQVGIDAVVHRGALWWRVTLRNRTGAEGETAQLAICRAALKAVAAGARAAPAGEG